MSKVAMLTFCAGDGYKRCMQHGLNSKAEYCKLHGIDFICEDDSASYYDGKRPMPWYKISMIKHHLLKYDFVFWSDADVLIKNFSFSINEYASQYRNTNFVFAKDFNAVNTGHFFVNNIEYSMDMLDLIYQQEHVINHMWWEQAAVILLLRDVESFSSRCHIEENGRLFNAFTPDLIEKEGKKVDAYIYKDKDFLIHYPGFKKEQVLRMMKRDINS